MENFWQLFCNKNIVNQVSNAFTGSTHNAKASEPDTELLFQVDESALPLADTFTSGTKPKETPQKFSNDNSVKSKVTTENNLRPLTITFQGKKININVAAKLNDDNSMELVGEKKTDKGIITYKAQVNADGEVTAYRIEHKYTNGTMEAEFYEEHDNTKPQDKSTKCISGKEFSYLDENGEATECSYTSEVRDKKTGAVEIRNSGEAATTGVREQIRDYYIGSTSSYTGTAIERGENVGLSREAALLQDADGNWSLNPNIDEIRLDCCNGEKFAFTTNDFVNATSVRLSREPESDSEMVEFPQIGEIETPNMRTVPEDIIKNGGTIEHIMGDGTIKTEFYQEVDGEIIYGYTTKNTDGVVLDDYRETYDSTNQQLKSKQQIKYDADSGKHFGEKQMFDSPNGIDTEYTHSYYIQGNMGGTIRYTSGAFEQNGTFIPDGNEDTVKFEQAGKEYSVPEVQELLTFEGV